MLAKVEQGRFRGRAATEYLSVSGSAHRGQGSVSSMAQARRLDFVNR